MFDVEDKDNFMLNLFAERRAGEMGEGGDKI